MEQSVSYEHLLELSEKRSDETDFGDLDKFILPTDNLLPNNTKFCLKNELHLVICKGKSIELLEISEVLLGNVDSREPLHQF